MAKLTIVFGVLLIVVGAVGYFGTGSVHPTALIPAGFGLLMAICGGLALTENPKKRMLWMHIAITVGLLGFLGTITGVIGWVKMLQGVQPEYPAAVEAKSVMCLLCLIFVALCVRSFIAARRSRIQ